MAVVLIQYAVYMYVCMYLFVYAGYFMYMAANKADVDLRPVNNTQWAETRPQHRELRALRSKRKGIY